MRTQLNMSARREGGCKNMKNNLFKEEKFCTKLWPKKLEAFLIHLLLLYPLLHFFAKMRRKLDDYPLLWRLPGCTKFPEVPELDCLTKNTPSSSPFTLALAFTSFFVWIKLLLCLHFRIWAENWIMCINRDGTIVS